ncbi:14 kDa phosphohistidine phosphatase-like isoform X2 [Panonychus citri]|uniref:14 kDa phosphohistidine phosphatase-like isoform X2 n=1 Tax=Panonychus citri TaxID=50023 RepID=UPI002306DED4|nr:14 kDa phosphohistidine phosphatase-like isoform X2 [Panonychus citri]XP_053203087.1 14 kDa phosphohistidine phosphatase-like isoform X2 [Panonychus citri]
MIGIKCLHLIPYLGLQRYSVLICSLLLPINLSKQSLVSQLSGLSTIRGKVKSTTTTTISSNKMDSIKEVDIDERGKFKYILITVKDDSGGEKLIVRGYRDCGYHADILERVQSQLVKFNCDSPGGGRISHDPNEKKLLVYGYSMGFGRADHQKTVEILKKSYPDYTIDWSNEGY